MDLEMRIFLICLLPFVFLTSATHAMESIAGKREPCKNEGEEIAVDSIKDFHCFKCICQNGFVECEQEHCPSVDDCYMLIKKPPGGCCEKCKDCFYKGKIYNSGAEWSDPDDPCASFKCIAGVVTEANLQCYTPCSNPLPPRPGKCCPTCLGCSLNGQTVHEGREVTLSEDPCLKCHCTNKRLVCVKKACPVLQCPPSKQIQGECCPRCRDRKEVLQVPGKCIFGKGFHSDNTKFEPDICSSCTCKNGTSICRRNTCPVLECPREWQKTTPGDCCPHCLPISEFLTVCTYDGKTYQNNDTWNLGPCASCRCHSGVITCAQMKCPEVKCRRNETLVTPPGQCCAKCEEIAGICTVFGDPHYKTFDGKFFSFQGSCKYQLTADCVGHTFSIRVTNDGRQTKSSSWTKTVTLKIGNIKVNLGQKLRIKVNGTRIIPPYKLGTDLTINTTEEGVTVDTKIGIKLLWDGSNFLQVQAPVTYKNKLCGLCGNYNNVWRDDLTTRRGKSLSDAHVWRFANSWRVGGTKSCTRKNENFARNTICKNSKLWFPCKPLKESTIFGDCGSRLNPINYFDSCKKDMCECPNGMCYCESFAAYAHECERLGVVMPNWRLETQCSMPGSKAVVPQKLEQIQRHRKRTRKPDDLRKHVPKAFLIHPNSGRTPPPLH